MTVKSTTRLLKKRGWPNK